MTLQRLLSTHTEAQQAVRVYWLRRTDLYWLRSPEAQRFVIFSAGWLNSNEKQVYNLSSIAQAVIIDI